MPWFAARGDIPDVRRALRSVAVVWPTTSDPAVLPLQLRNQDKPPKADRLLWLDSNQQPASIADGHPCGMAWLAVSQPFGLAAQRLANL